MWKEWLVHYNPFNPLKILFESERITHALKWAEGGTDEPPKPIMAVVALSSICNVNCQWCNVARWRQQVHCSLDKELEALSGVLAEMGAVSIKITGGEPLLVPTSLSFMRQLKALGLKIVLETNGTKLLDAEIGKGVAETCDWVIISVDAVSNESYLAMKKASLKSFERVIGGISYLVDCRRPNRKPHLTMKFLLHHLNHLEVYSFASLAKQLGVDSVLLTPAYIPNYQFSRSVRKSIELGLRESRKQLETNSFKIYGIVNRVGREWGRIIRFSKCSAVAFSPTITADKKLYACWARVGDEKLLIGEWKEASDIKKLWGSPRHRQIVLAMRGAGLEECPVCPFSVENEVVEFGILDDSILRGMFF